ncbi:hypothetical protein BT67DRAFT_151298 [Trichocladium antarcticum]|uniref:Uncharacterized protein n=1 Tax=Trichocladium antarcticum TaxID=1450529 RepID=A0AAN6UEJ2_9PEZI|nr:hypothetical protein BT67DRAFT_151298 [Trichocladium antarcticum]
MKQERFIHARKHVLGWISSKPIWLHWEAVWDAVEQRVPGKQKQQHLGGTGDVCWGHMRHGVAMSISPSRMSDGRTVERSNGRTVLATFRPPVRPDGRPTAGTPLPCHTGDGDAGSGIRQDVRYIQIDNRKELTGGSAPRPGRNCAFSGTVAFIARSACVIIMQARISKKGPCHGWRSARQTTGWQWYRYGWTRTGQETHPLRVLPRYIGDLEELVGHVSFLRRG